MQSLGAEGRDLQAASSLAVSDSKFKAKKAGPGVCSLPGLLNSE